MSVTHFCFVEDKEVMCANCSCKAGMPHMARFFVLQKRIECTKETIQPIEATQKRINTGLVGKTKNFDKIQKKRLTETKHGDIISELTPPRLSFRQQESKSER